jgi:hypothetical protein
MRNSLTEIAQAEAFLQETMPPRERLVFEARVLTNPLLRVNLFFQKKAYGLLKLYHRQQLKKEVQAVEQRLFQDPEKKAFQQQIHHLFNPRNP